MFVSKVPQKVPQFKKIMVCLYRYRQTRCINNQILLMQNDNANIVHILVTPIAAQDLLVSYI